MIVKLLTEHHLEFLSLKGGFRGSSEARQNATLLKSSCTDSNHMNNDVIIPPANFVCGGYTVFTLSVRPCVRP